MRSKSTLAMFATVAVTAFACKQAPTNTKNAPPANSIEVFGAANIQAAEAQAACRAFDGSWRCAKIQPRAIMAASATPIIPVSWTVSAWFIDPSNSSGVASDTNACTTSGAPCLTWQEIAVHRWGCLGTPTACPRLRQDTTINWMSSHVDDSDPVYFRPAVENNKLLVQQGTLTTVATLVGGLAIISKTRGAPGQLLNGTLGASGAINQLLINQTHPSHAWAYKSLGANVFAVTQPLNIGTLPAALPQNVLRAEVDTWASGDTVTLNTVPFINLVDFRPIIEDGGANAAGTNAKAYLSQLGVFDPGTRGDMFRTNSQVRGFDVQFQRTVAVGDVIEPTSGAPGCANCLFQESFTKSVITGPAFVLTGGAVKSTINVLLATGVSLDADIIINTPVSQIASFMVMGFVYADSAAQFVTQNGSQIGNFNGYGGQQLWGICAASCLVLQGAGRFVYPTGAGAAAANITLSVGGLRIGSNNPSTVGCLAVPSAANSFATCNIALTPANLDANLGATSGCLTAGGSGAFCNF